MHGSRGTIFSCTKGAFLLHQKHAQNQATKTRQEQAKQHIPCKCNNQQLWPTVILPEQEMPLPKPPNYNNCHNPNF
eukprot:14022486-Ditylum_brightwellii.AAC.1